MSADHEIALATLHDIPGIIELQERNLRENGGELSVRLPRQWFEAALSDMPIIVARRDGHVVGYLVCATLAGQAHDPIVQAMLRAYPGSPGAYIYGPICVAESERGRGLAIAMFNALRARLPSREGFTFIRRDNTMSIKVHTRMGMREVAEFTRGDVAYVVVAYAG